MSDALSSAARLPAAPPDAGDDIETRVRHRISVILNLPMAQVDPAALLGPELGADSLDRVEAWMVLEEEFTVDLDDAAVDRCERVSDLVNLVREASEKAAARQTRDA